MDIWRASGHLPRRRGGEAAIPLGRPPPRSELAGYV